MIPTIHAPKALEPVLRMFTEFLEHTVASGTEFQPEESIQCGWMWFRVGGDAEAPAILAPKFGPCPMEFQPDCSGPLNLVLTQNYLAESFQVELMPCDARQSALVIKDIGECTKIFMNRLGPAEESDSGWFFGAQDTALDVNDPNSMTRLSLWELLCTYPLSADFFMLPEGFQVLLEEQPVVLKDYEEAAFAADSYFAKSYR